MIVGELPIEVLVILSFGKSYTSKEHEKVLSRVIANDWLGNATFMEEHGRNRVMRYAWRLCC